jgi:CubicO group peptidase (beta-lactamase class C family)
MPAYLFLLIGILLPGIAVAQANTPEPTVRTGQAEALPIRDLGTTKILFVTAKTGADAILEATLARYAPVTPMPTDPQAAYRELATADYVISVLGDREPSARETAWFEVIKSLTASNEGPAQLVFVQLGGALRDQAAVNRERKLAAYLHFPAQSPAAFERAAQLIFGAGDPHPALPRPAGWAPRLAYASPAAVGMDSTILHDSIAAIVEEGIAAGAFPGAQVLVARRGRIVYHEAFGHHTYAGERPVRRDDIYDLASVTKTSSALAALLRLHGQGRFDLDAPLSHYFDFGPRSNKDTLTMRKMLAHHARLRPWIPYWRSTLRGNARYPWRRGWSNTRLNDGRFRWRTFKPDSSRRFPIRVTDELWLHRKYKKQIYKAIRKSPLEAEPGYRYSGLLFYLLPQIVEDLVGMDYETYLRDSIYAPLGATTITYNPLRFFPRERIVPTERDTFFRMQLLHGTVHDEGAAMMAGVSANAGLFATAGDLAKLWQMYLNGGRYGGQQIIAAGSLAEFTRCPYCDEGNRRGIGFDKPEIEYDPATSSVAEAASAESFGHSGYTGTFVWADPQAELLYIFFSNRVYPTRDNPLIYRRNIRPRIHAALYRAIQ